MQRKDIKIGETYGVLAHVSKRAKATAGAKVIDFDGEYKGRTGGTWGRTVTKTGGITVEFDRPVIKRWDGYVYVDEILNGQWADHVKEEAKENAITRDVLPSSRHVVDLWSKIQADRAAMRENEERWARERADKAAAFAPRRAALEAALIEHGLVDEVKVNYQRPDRNDNSVVTGFAQILISASALEKLLGITQEGGA